MRKGTIRCRFLIWGMVFVVVSCVSVSAETQFLSKICDEVKGNDKVNHPREIIPPL